MMDLTVGNILVHLTFDDLMEYQEYRQVALAVKEIRPSTVVLGPVDWYRKYKPDMISGKGSDEMD